MRTSEELQAGFVLGEWEILPSRGICRKDGGEIRPEPLAMRVLLSLAQRDGELVTRDDLIQDAWDGRPTADDPINRAIAQVRKLLGDTQKPPEYIETLHRRGYRLIKPVEALASSDPATDADNAPAEFKTSRRTWKTIALLLLALVVLTAGLWAFKRVPADSIAVVPFENLSGVASDDYIVSGFKEALIQSLHGARKLTVKNGRVRYELEDDQIASLLGVNNVLHGSLRRNGDAVVVMYTVHQVGKGIVHSGDVSGDVDELFVMQEKLASQIVTKLRGKSAPTLIKSRPNDSVAYDSYMRGLFALEQRGELGNLEDAIDLLQHSISLDAGYGPAYLSLAAAYLLMVDYRRAPMEEYHGYAQRTISQGVRNDPQIAAAANAIYGFIYHKEKRWQESELAYLEAVNADVVDSNAFNWYSRMLASVGRLDDALEQAQRAVDIDPSSAVANTRVAIAHTWLQNSDSAHEYFLRAQELGELGTTQLLAYAFLLARDGDLESAQQLAVSGVQSAGISDAWVNPLFAALTDASQIPLALEKLDEAAANDQLPVQVNLTARTMLGDINGAMQVAKMLEMPGEIFEMDLLFIPELRPLRQHPQFLPLLERVGVADYWRNAGCEWSDDRVICD